MATNEREINYRLTAISGEKLTAREVLKFLQGVSDEHLDGKFYCHGNGGEPYRIILTASLENES